MIKLLTFLFCLLMIPSVVLASADATAEFGNVVRMRMMGKIPAFSCEYSIKTDQKRIRKPLLYVYIMYENDDKTVGVYKGHDKYTANYPSVEHKIESISKGQPEVAAASLKKVSVKDFNIGWNEAYGKVILWRLEIWCDGRCLASHSSMSDKMVQTKNIPLDWYKK